MDIDVVAEALEMRHSIAGRMTILLQRLRCMLEARVMRFGWEMVEEDCGGTRP